MNKFNEQIMDKYSWLPCVLAGLGFVEAKASKMVSKSAEKNKTDPLSVVDEIMKNPQMKEDIGSKNQKKFRKDKELDKQKIKQLKYRYLLQFLHLSLRNL